MQAGRKLSFLSHVANDASRHAGDDGIVWDVLRYDGSGTDQGAYTDRYSRYNRCI